MGRVPDFLLGRSEVYMAAAAELLKSEVEPISVEERHLTEVNHLAENRLSDGSYPDEVLEDVLSNLKTAVQEGGIPHAVSTTEHKFQPLSGRSGVFKWMGKTAVQNAMSGYRFHINEAAKARVDVEVDEARLAEEDLRPGVAKIFISPKMSQQDADHETAKLEHLADDDAVRVSWLETDNEGRVEKRIMQSLLVRDIPLGAWTSMLQDPDNIFEKSVELEDTDSALSVMKAHRELEVPVEDLPEGPVNIVKAVLPYIKDPEAHKKVEKQIEMFESNQDQLDTYAEKIAERWLKFEVELEQSLNQGEATFEIKRFIAGLQHNWGKAELRMIQNHSFGEEYMMSRELASLLEKAKKKGLWTSASIISGNEAVIKQVEPEVAEQIRRNEMRLQQAYGSEQAAIGETENNRLIASRRIKVGGGCAGEIDKDKEPWELDADGEEKGWEKDPKKWKQGTCKITKGNDHSSLVGPCKVCTKCQAKFDKGKDPSK